MMDLTRITMRRVLILMDLTSIEILEAGPTYIRVPIKKGKLVTKSFSL